MKRISMTKTLLFFSAVLLLASCATQKRCAKKYPCQGNSIDTLIVEKLITKRDTVVQFKILTDTVKEVIEIQVPTGVTINTPEHRLNTRYAYSLAGIKNNRLFHTLVQHDAMIEQVIKDAITVEVNKVKQSSSKTVVVKENYLTGWQWTQVYIGRFFLLLCGIAAFLLLLKLIIKKGF